MLVWLGIVKDLVSWISELALSTLAAMIVGGAGLIYHGRPKHSPQQDLANVRVDIRAHNKQLVEESFAKIEFVPETRAAGDEIVLAEPGGQSTLKRRRPPYLDQLKSHLRGYPEAQKLLDELPRIWSEARAEDSEAFDMIEMAIRDKLKTCIAMPQLMSASQALADGMRTDIISDCDGALGVSRGYPSQVTNGRIGVRGVDLSDAEECVGDLTQRMDELSRDIELKKKFCSVKERYENVRFGKVKFAEEVRNIIEAAQLSQYDDLGGVCSVCEKMKRIAAK